MKQIKFIPVKDDSQINQIAILADKIWREHYSKILDAKADQLYA